MQLHEGHLFDDRYRPREDAGGDARPRDTVPRNNNGVDTTPRFNPELSRSQNPTKENISLRQPSLSCLAYCCFITCGNRHRN